MLKLKASFGKKVPADQEYSSKSYHAEIEVELSDGLNQQQLQDKIRYMRHSLWLKVQWKKN